MVRLLIMLRFLRRKIDMTEAEVREKARVLAAAGDAMSAEVLRLFEHRDALQSHLMAFAERIQLQSELLSKRAADPERATATARPRPQATRSQGRGRGDHVRTLRAGTAARLRSLLLDARAADAPQRLPRVVSHEGTAEGGKACVAIRGEGCSLADMAGM